MSEFEVVTGKAPEAESEGGGCKTCGLSCLGILILSMVVIGVMSANASARLDARFLEASKEVTELQAAADVRRGTVLGAPANDENAVVDYNGLEWVLTSGKGGNRRNSWEKQAPVLPDDIDFMVKRTNPDGEEIDLILPSALLVGIDPDCSVKDTPQERARRKKAEALFKRLRPALRYVRDGLKRGKCDWETQWERGMRFELPNLLAMRTVGNLMAYEASLQPPSEAVETGLQIVAFGEDNARQGTLIGGMIGIAVSAIGFKSLAHTLGRPGCTASDYRRVITALEGYRGPPADALLAGERLAGVITGLELSGRPLEAAGSEEVGYDAGTTEKALFRFSMFHVREMEGYEYFLQREIEISRMPREQRQVAREELEKELEDSWYLVAKIAIPNLSAAQDNVIEAEALARIVRVLAAAHLVRLQDGAFPNSIQGVAQVLGKGIEDPCATTPGAPLSYSFEGGKVYCWAVGEDKISDGGARSWKDKSPPPPNSSDDRGLLTQAPAE
jgi:hypothetical protein